MIFSLPRTYLDTVTFRAMLHHGKEPFPQIWVDVREGSDAAKAGKKFEPIAKAQLKKVTYIEVRPEVSKSSKNGVFYKSSYLRFEFFISPRK